METAKQLLWQFTKQDLELAGLSFHSRRNSDKRSQLAADLDDILQAFLTLDSAYHIPEIYCEATDLLRVPPLSLDPVSEQVQTNTQALHNLISKIESLEKEISVLQGSGTSIRSSIDQSAITYAAAASVTAAASVSSPKDAVASCSSIYRPRNLYSLMLIK